MGGRNNPSDSTPCRVNSFTDSLTTHSVFDYWKSVRWTLVVLLRSDPNFSSPKVWSHIVSQTHGIVFIVSTVSRSLSFSTLKHKPFNGNNTKTALNKGLSVLHSNLENHHL